MVFLLSSQLLSQFLWLGLYSFLFWTLFLSFHPSPFQASGGGALAWATAPGTPVLTSRSASVTTSTLPEEAPADETNNPTSESDPESTLNAAAEPFQPAARPAPRKPPRRHGA